MVGIVIAATTPIMPSVIKTSARVKPNLTLFDVFFVFFILTPFYLTYRVRDRIVFILHSIIELCKRLRKKLYARL